MKKLIFAFLAIIVVMSVSFSQDMPTQSSKAIFGSYAGSLGSVGLRYWVTSDIVIVPAVTFGIYNITDKGQGGNSDQTDNTTSIGLSVAGELHAPPISVVSPFLIGGIGFVSSSETIKYSLAPGTPAANTLLERDYSATPISIFVGFGAEAALAKSVGVGFNYQLAVSFGGGKQTDKCQGQADATTEKSTFGLDLSTAAVWLAVYF